jgi:hypothetical protein
MKAYYIETNERCFDYIGCWYARQHNPQPLSLNINGDTHAVSIEHDPNIGSGCSPDQWHNIELMFDLPITILTEQEAAEIIQELRPLIDKLLDSYERYYNGNNYVGKWGGDAIDELHEKCYTIYADRISVAWDEEGILNETQDEEL